MKELTATTVSRALRRAGIPVGYRYTQTGYVRDREPVTEPGCEVTRSKRARYGGTEDAGCVLVYPIDPSKSDGSVDFDFMERVIAALKVEFIVMQQGLLNLRVLSREG